MNLWKGTRMRICMLAAVLAVAAPALAQTPAPAADTNAAPPVPPTAGGFFGERKELFENSYRGGEQTVPYPNVWDGVDSKGDLHMIRMVLPVLNNDGRMVDTPFPTSPNFVDMNNDGLEDLVVGDSAGYVWIYLNSGEKGKPRFTTGTFLHTFIGNGAKLCVTDWDQDGDFDIITGTYYGDVAFLENTGTRVQYDFVKSMGVPRYVMPRGVDRLPKFAFPHLLLGAQAMVIGNYLCPWVEDWNNDGKPDLLMGEGTYSANSVRLLLNAGSRGRPVFVPERVFYLAYGEGFEHLTPCVLDYNGDGFKDLIVGTRTGEFRKHKGTKASTEGTNVVATLRGVQGPAILEFDGFLSIGGSEKHGIMSIAHPCDWNNDGLIDLILGQTDATLKLAINTGTKSSPEYKTAVPIKGTDVDLDCVAPAGWSMGVPEPWTMMPYYCNSAFMLSSETSVQAGPIAIVPVEGQRFVRFRYMKGYQGWIDDNTPGARTIYAPSVKMEVGKKYDFSCSVMLKASGPARWQFRSWQETREPTEDSPGASALFTVEDSIPLASSWQKRAKTFVAPGSDLVKSYTNQADRVQSYELWFQMPPGDADFCVDDLSLKESRY